MSRGPHVLEDDLNDPWDKRPYREGDKWICRNCAAEMDERRTYCDECRIRKYQHRLED